MNDDMPRFPWGTLVTMVVIFGLLYVSCEQVRKKELADPMVRSECREGYVWYKWRMDTYWTISGASEGRQPTKCSN